MDKITDKEFHDSLNMFDEIVPRWLSDEQLQMYECTAYNAYLDAQKEIYFRGVLYETNPNMEGKNE